MTEHGGALRAAMRAWPDASSPWLDLSTGINPIAYPVEPLPPAVWARLPEREDIADLEEIARIAYRASAAVDVVAAPGAQSLIQLLPRLFPATSVAVLGPTYAEHAACWRAAGTPVRVIEALTDAGPADTLVVVNPNNPDGRLLPPSELSSLAIACGRRGGRLVVDESFADVMPGAASLAPLLGAVSTIVLRSFGKAFGLGGLRLGFALADRADGARIRDALGPWAVSGPAVAIGRRALADGAWLAAARLRLAADAARLDTLLGETGFAVRGGTPLFRLAAHPRAEAVHAHLCSRGILVRRFAQAPTHLRFGLPGATADWERLAAALHGARGSATIVSTGSSS